MADREAFNVNLLQVDERKIRLLTPVGTLDIFDSRDTGKLHAEGFYSTEIFGEFGSKERDQTFSYINLKTEILHPIIFKRLMRIRKFYTEIMAGKKFAIFDDEKKDFVEKKRGEGQTGYSFFIKHFPELDIPKGDSEIRKQRVELINRYKDKARLNYALIMPSGLRDIEIDDFGGVEEDEINPLYRRLFGISSTIEKTTQTDDPALDNARYAQQLSFNLIYDYIEEMLTGKKGFIQQRWGARRIFNGTRNVITSMDVSSPELGREDYPGVEDTVMGLWQLSKGALPITIHKLRTNILASRFGDSEGQARLVDPKTYKSQWVDIDSSTYDRWVSSEGLERIISLQASSDYRSMPVTVEDYYLALVYKPKDWEVFKIFDDIDELPEGYSKDDVYPITYMEMIYLANYRNWNDLRVVITRYPVSGEGSTYPSKVYVRTTVNSESRVELDKNWQPMEPEGENTALVYPIFDPPTYIDSTMVHPSRVGGLGADYDGDTVCANVIYTKEGIEEIDQYFQSRQAYVDPKGGMRASMHIDNVKLVMHNLTSNIEE